MSLPAIVTEMTGLVARLENTRTAINQITELQGRILTVSKETLDELASIYQQPREALVNTVNSLPTLKSLLTSNQNFSEKFHEINLAMDAMSNELTALLGHVPDCEDGGLEEVNSMQLEILQEQTTTKSSLALAKGKLQEVHLICQEILSELGGYFKNFSANKNDHGCNLRLKEFLTAKEAILYTRALETLGAIYTAQTSCEKLASYFRSFQAGYEKMDGLHQAFEAQLNEIIDNYNSQLSYKDVLFQNFPTFVATQIAVALTGVTGWTAMGVQAIGLFISPLQSQSSQSSVTDPHMSQYILGKQQAHITIPTVANSVKARFYPYSTGRLSPMTGKKQSTRKGLVSILMPKKGIVKTFEFDLQLEGEHKISTPNLLLLITEMTRMMTTSKADKIQTRIRHALRVIELLANSKIKVSEGEEVDACFIDRESPLIKCFEIYCKTMLMRSIFYGMVNNRL